MIILLPSHVPAQALLAILNVTAHSSTASVPITVLLYNGPLLCGFDLPIKEQTVKKWSCVIENKKPN